MIDIKGISYRRKIAIVIAVFFLLVVSWSGFIDDLSKEYVNSSTLQALAAYGFARLINSAVSLASSISISASLGIGFDVQPFQILDPINDLVEQYSSAMKFSVSSLVVQKIFIEAVSTLVFKIVLTVLSVVFVISMYVKDGEYSFFFFRVLSFFGMVRFLIVLVVLMNGIVDQAFVDKNISPRMQEVSDVANNIAGQASVSKSQLSEDERAGLESMMDTLIAEREKVVESLSFIENEISQSTEKVKVSQSQVDEVESEMGTVERLNVFSREKDYKIMLKELELSREEYSENINVKDDLAERLERVDKDIENTIDLLEGKAVEDSWFAGASNKISSFRDMAKWERITKAVESIVPSLLNLMAAFILKTSIMPLIFLLLFLKGFKYVWGMDPRRLIKQEYEKIKNAD